MRRSDFAGSRMPPMAAAAWRSLTCFLLVAGGPLRNVGLLTETAVVVGASQSLTAAGAAEPGSGTRELEDCFVSDAWSGTVTPLEEEALGPWSGTTRPADEVVGDAFVLGSAMASAMNLQKLSGYAAKLAVFHFPSVLFSYLRVRAELCGGTQMGFPSRPHLPESSHGWLHISPSDPQPAPQQMSDVGFVAQEPNRH